MNKKGIGIRGLSGSQFVGLFYVVIGILFAICFVIGVLVFFGELFS